MVISLFILVALFILHVRATPLIPSSNSLSRIEKRIYGEYIAGFCQFEADQSYELHTLVNGHHKRKYYLAIRLQDGSGRLLLEKPINETFEVFDKPRTDEIITEEFFAKYDLPDRFLTSQILLRFGHHVSISAISTPWYDGIPDNFWFAFGVTKILVNDTKTQQQGGFALPDLYNHWWTYNINNKPHHYLQSQQTICIVKGSFVNTTTIVEGNHVTFANRTIVCNFYCTDTRNFGNELPRVGPPPGVHLVPGFLP